MWSGVLGARPFGRCLVSGLAGVLLLLPVAACGSKQPYFVAANEPWRGDLERMCLRSGLVRETNYIDALKAISGPSVCGARKPFSVSAVSNGRVALEPEATLRCGMIPAVEEWVADVVQPAARKAFGEEVTAMRVAASYACRPRNNRAGGRLSEHGYANAIDISRFTLADGRVVSVEADWNGGSPQEKVFLREVHAGACGPFTTVLGPEADAAHRTHFHFDLARRGQNGRGLYCR